MLRKSNFGYQDFVGFMRRYQAESASRFVKSKHNSPYKYKKVFNKDRKHEFKRTSDKNC